MIDQTTSAAERSAHVTRGGAAPATAPRPDPFVGPEFGPLVSRRVYDLEQEVERLRKIINDVWPALQAERDALRGENDLLRDMRSVALCEMEWQIKRAQAAEAERDALRARVEWQPMETAPRDGTRVVLYGAGYTNNEAFLGEWWDDGWHAWYECCGYAPLASPTHWMALPEPPA